MRSMDPALAPPSETRAPDLAVPLGERRSEERAKVSVYRSATLRWDGHEGLCLIRNISSGGMMGRVHGDFAPGQQVEVEMRSGRCVSGQVIWVEDQQIGVEFAERIDVHSVLNAAADPSGRVQRMPRLSVACPCTLLSDNSLLTVTLVDLSQGGAKIEAAFLRAGDEVSLAVPGLEPRRGVIRWARRGHAGIAFDNALPFDMLARWAIDRQQRG